MKLKQATAKTPKKAARSVTKKRTPRAPKTIAPTPHEPVPFPGYLRDGEIHPAAHAALKALKGIPIRRQMLLLEAYQDAGMQGDRNAQICAATLHRFVLGHPIGDLYAMGLFIDICVNSNLTPSN